MEGREEGRKESIRIFVDICRKMSLSRKEVLDKLLSKYKLDAETAESYLEHY